VGSPLDPTSDRAYDVGVQAIPTDGLRPLGPRTRAEYDAILRLAFAKGDLARDPKPVVMQWAEPRRVVLRAAIKRRLMEAGETPAAIADSIARVPKQAGYKQKKVRIPGEAEVERFKAAVEEVVPLAKRPFAILPLALGLRAAEVLTLPRKAIQAAIDDGTLRFIRKGGKEGELPVEHVTELLQALLDTPAMNGKPWRTAGQILSQGDFRAQYHALWVLIRRAGAKARLGKLRPHLLRHAFGTRMNRDGAPLLTIKEALGHASVTTTQRYVHPEADDVRRYMRKV
jgi:integrase